MSTILTFLYNTLYEKTLDKNTYKILNNDIIRKIANELNHIDIISLCLSCKQNNLAIYDDEIFWQGKVKKHYSKVQFSKTWKNTHYLYSYNVFVKGDMFNIPYTTELCNFPHMEQMIKLPKMYSSTSVSCGKNLIAFIQNGELVIFYLKNPDANIRENPYINTNNRCDDKIISVEYCSNIKNAKQVCCANDFGFVLAGGQIYTFGYTQSKKYMLGYDDGIYSSWQPKLIPNFKNVSFIECSENHFAFIMGGEIYTWGRDHWGELGHDNIGLFEIPTKIENFTHVTYVSYGHSHTALIADARLYTFGSGDCGQLGHGNYDNLKTPKLVNNLENVTLVSCYTQYTVVVANNKLYFFGNVVFGYCCNKPTVIFEIKNISQIVPQRNKIYIIADNKLYNIYLGYVIKVEEVTHYTNIKSISAWGGHLAIITNNQY